MSRRGGVIYHSTLENAAPVIVTRSHSEQMRRFLLSGSRKGEEEEGGLLRLCNGEKKTRGTELGMKRRS